MKPVYTITDLRCSYFGKVNISVLFIPHLNIERGKLTFILGSSGSGKSTLLETLGLMNNTIVSGSVIFNENEVTPININELWSKNEKKKIAGLRKKHFSFIFQNTNLMDNFTAYENVCLSDMIKTNQNQEKAFQKTLHLMENVGLGLGTVNLNTISVNLSGGQRQRLSFVRALNSEFTVLLCDEPTGNLDEKNANELYSIIKGNLTENQSAIIVSHDINLALKYADDLIVISKNHEKGYGEIHDEYIYKRIAWESKNSTELNEFKIYLKSLFEFDGGKEINNIHVLEKGNNKLAASYQQLFYKKENATLRGKKKVNFIILCCILLLTFLSVGFANGVLNYLNQKIDDPFVNYVTAIVPNAKTEEFSEIKSKLNNDDIKNRYQIKSVTSYREFYCDFTNNDKDQEPIEYKGRTVESIDEPFLKTVLDKRNLICSDCDNSAFCDTTDLGLIIKKSVLTELKIDEETPFIYLEKTVIDEGESFKFKVPIPVRAVVNEIPGKINFIATKYFYNARAVKYDNPFDLRQYKRNFFLFINTPDKDVADKIKEILNGIAVKNNYFFTTGELRKNDKYYSYRKGFFLNIVAENGISFNAADSLFRSIINNKNLSDYKNKIFRYFNIYSFNAVVKPITPDALCINFDELDSIRPFSRYLSRNFNSEKEEGKIEIDESLIKEKENFVFMANNTRIIAILLILFCITSVSLFLSNLLRTHLSKVKMNIGTFKAFGLSDISARNIYINIMIRFIIIGGVISFTVALFAGFGLDRLIGSYINVEKGISYFKLIHVNTLIVVIILMATVITVCWYNIKRILSKTPGDLIYNR